MVLSDLVTINLQTSALSGSEVSGQRAVGSEVWLVYGKLASITAPLTRERPGIEANGKPKGPLLWNHRDKVKP